MDHRDQLHGKSIQDSGLNQHVRFPVAGLQSFEPPSMVMERMAALHDADIQNLLITNQKLLESHQTLRQNLYNTEKDIEKIRDNLRSVEVLSGFHMSELVGLIRKMEAEICAGAAVKELLEVHLEADKLRAEKQELSVKSLEVHFEADKLCAEKQELSVKLQELTDRIEIIEKCCDGKACSPELHAEIDRLKEQYRSARAILEDSRDIKKEQVKQMKTMEMSLNAVTEQVNKFRVELQDADIRAQELAMVAKAIADDSGTADSQTMPAGIGPHESANNFPSAYHQETQEGQFGVAQDPSASAVVYPHESLYVYLPAVSYQQATEGWVYGYTVPYEDTNRMVYYLPVQVREYAYYYPIANDEPQHTVLVNGDPEADAAGMDGDTGSPSWHDETDGDTTTSLAETSETSSDTLSLPSLARTRTEEVFM